MFYNAFTNLALAGLTVTNPAMLTYARDLAGR